MTTSYVVQPVGELSAGAWRPLLSALALASKHQPRITHKWKYREGCTALSCMH